MVASRVFFALFLLLADDIAGVRLSPEAVRLLTNGFSGLSTGWKLVCQSFIGQFSFARKAGKEFPPTVVLRLRMLPLILTVLNRDCNRGTIILIIPIKGCSYKGELFNLRPIRVMNAECSGACGGLGGIGFDVGAFTHASGQSWRKVWEDS